MRAEVAGFTVDFPGPDDDEIVTDVLVLVRTTRVSDNGAVTDCVAMGTSPGTSTLTRRAILDWAYQYTTPRPGWAPRREG